MFSLAIWRGGLKVAACSSSEPLPWADGLRDVGGSGMVVDAIRMEATRPLSGSSPDSPCHRELREGEKRCGCACETGRFKRNKNYASLDT
jgi:hypothetical protein